MVSDVQLQIFQGNKNAIHRRRLSDRNLMVELLSCDHENP